MTLVRRTSESAPEEGITPFIETVCQLAGEAGERELVEQIVRDSSVGDGHSSEPRLQADSPTARRADFEQWCREVRDPAIEHSEGRRTICTAHDEARLEYEIAPLPGGGWAVN